MLMVKDTIKLENLLAEVRGWRHYPQPFFPLPHPSPRNIGWLQLNPWFEEEVLPALRKRVRSVFCTDIGREKE
jgi:uracil-DNA glycosylase